MNRQKILSWSLIFFILLLGAISTGYWLYATGVAAFTKHILSFDIYPPLFLCILLTFCNLLLRWFRWHLLIRRFTLTIPTRISFIIYFSTLPALVIPFYLGELVRVFLVRGKYQTKTRYLVFTWFFERLADTFVLLTFLLFARGHHEGLLLFIILAGLIFYLVNVLQHSNSLLNRSFVSCAILGVSTLSWFLPIFSLQQLLSVFHNNSTILFSMDLFSSSTLLGGITGIPLGTFVTGSEMINRLVGYGINLDYAAITTYLFRMGTVWFTVLLGIVLLYKWREAISFLLSKPSQHRVSHFDEIADQYQDQIPEHIRQRLLLKKIAPMKTHLERINLDRGSRGLDLGCGQGWYMCVLADSNYKMFGIDLSMENLEWAARNAEHRGLKLFNSRADAALLPFPSNSFDFVYSINMVHHISDPDLRANAFEEIVRVLRPGGAFFLHEINTKNPLFRLYMGYIFPLIRTIDNGTEKWILPGELPEMEGGAWQEIKYFTFLPDFSPHSLTRALSRLESYLESSRFCSLSAHYMAVFMKRE